MQGGGLRSAMGCVIIKFMKIQRNTIWLLLFSLLLAALSGCGLMQPEETADPHAGMIEVNTGGGSAWVYPWDGAAVSDLTKDQFSAGDDGAVTYTGTSYRAEQGVDVSYFQGEIDWESVAASGISFAYIRAGFRGYISGEICTDERFGENAAAARAAGLEVGLYFFSQSVTPEEAEEEARWLLDAAAQYDITLPLAYDWEPDPGVGEAARTDGMYGAEITACAVAFCDTVREAGRVPAVYGNRWQGYYDLDLSQLTDAELWISAPGTWDDFYYAHSMWQYTYEGSVPGIEGNVDRDLRYLPITA